jgi:hypothetical protein
MRGGVKTVRLCHFLLHLFYPWVHNLNQSVAFYANKMVVMLVVIMVFESGYSIAKIYLPAKSGLR